MKKRITQNRGEVKRKCRRHEMSNRKTPSETIKEALKKIKRDTTPNFIVKRRRSNTLENIHVEVTITNGSGSKEVFEEIGEALMKMRRLRKMSYVVTEVSFEE